jgi:uncharacterized protein YajQ (UPF0234 family)
VSEVNLQDIDNAVTQTLNEVTQLYDQTNSRTSIFREEQSRFSSRNLFLKALNCGIPEPAA